MASATSFTKTKIDLCKITYEIAPARFNLQKFSLSDINFSLDEVAPVERASHLIYAIYCYVSVTGGNEIFDEAVPAYFSRNIHGSSAGDWLQQITGKRKLKNMCRSQPKRNPPAFDNITYFLFGSVPRLNIALQSNLFDCNVSNMDLTRVYFEQKSRKKKIVISKFRHVR